MPRRLKDALEAEPAVRADRWLAKILPVRTVLRGSLIAVWLGSGAASFALAPERVQVLLSRIAPDSATAVGITWAGATLDVVLGLALLVRSWRRRALQGHLVIIIIYTALATFALPKLWTDPFGSLLKNLAVFAAKLALLAIED